MEEYNKEVKELLNKVISKEFKKALEEANERRKLYQRRWKKNNKEKVRREHREYYKNNKEKVDEYIFKWRVKNKDKLKEYAKTWRDRNPNKDKEIRARYYKKNRELILKRAKRRYLNKKNDL